MTIDELKVIANRLDPDEIENRKELAKADGVGKKWDEIFDSGFSSKIAARNEQEDNK